MTDLTQYSRYEFPKSGLTQPLADLLPGWMEARTVSVPDTITYSSSGDNFQKFINAPALYIEDAGAQLKYSRKAHYLDYPGFSNTSRYMCYSFTKIESEEVGEYIYADASYTGFFGVSIPSLSRKPTRRIKVVDNLSDFYNGLVSVESAIYATGGTVILPCVADSIDWVTVSGVLETYTATVSATGDDLTERTCVTVPASSGYFNVRVKYRTTDVAKVAAIEYNRIYLNVKHNEVYLSATDKTYKAYVPSLYMLFNELDELGLYYDLPRLDYETNDLYKIRIQNAIAYPENSTTSGLMNSVANRLALIERSTLTAGASSLVLFNAYEDSLRLNLRAMDFYTWSAPYTISASGDYLDTNTVTWTTTVTAGEVDRALYFTARYNGSRIVNVLDVIPQVTITTPSSAYLIEEVVPITSVTQYLFDVQYNYLPRSTILYHNGSQKVRDIDFYEVGTKGIELLFVPSVDDLVTVSYVIQSSEVTDLLRSNIKQRGYIEDVSILSASVGASVVGKGYSSNMEPGDEAVFAVYLSNYGNVNLETVAVSATMPPIVEVVGADGFYTITSKTVPIDNIDVRYYTENSISLKPLWGSGLMGSLLDANFVATAELKSYAEVLRKAAPILWGDVVWDVGSWTSSAQWNSEDWTRNFSFTPNVFDPDLSNFQMVDIFSILFAPTIFNREFYGDKCVFGGIKYVGKLTTRIKDFQSGIRYDEDLKLTLDTDTLDTFTVSYEGIDRLYKDRVSKCWLDIVPGFYFFNNDTRYVFSDPRTITLTDAVSGLLPLTTASSLYTAETGTAVCTRPVMLTSTATLDNDEYPSTWRRVFFTDENNNPTLTFTESVTARSLSESKAADESGLYYAYTNSIELRPSFSGVKDATITSTEGVSATYSTYTDGASAVTGEWFYDNNIFTGTFPSSALGVYTLTYAVTGSYYVDWNYSAADALVLWSEQIPYARVTYDSSTSSVCHTDEFINPIHQVHTSGFVYLSDSYQQIGSITCWPVPGSITAGSGQAAMVVAEVLDAYYSPVSNVTVTFETSTGYLEGCTTDRFGRAEIFIDTSNDPQIIEVQVKVPVFDEDGVLLYDLSSVCYVEYFNPFWGPIEGPRYGYPLSPIDGPVASEDFRNYNEE